MVGKTPHKKLLQFGPGIFHNGENHQTRNNQSTLPSNNATQIHAAVDNACSAVTNNTMMCDWMEMCASAAASRRQKGGYGS